MSNKYALTVCSVDLGRLAKTATVALPLLLIASLHGGWPRPATAADAPQADGPSIVVLPLANPTGARGKAASRTRWSRTSSPTCPASACPPSRPARASATATSPTTRGRSAVSSASATWSRAGWKATANGCGPPSTWSTSAPARGLVRALRSARSRSSPRSRTSWRRGSPARPAACATPRIVPPWRRPGQADPEPAGLRALAAGQRGEGAQHRGGQREGARGWSGRRSSSTRGSVGPTSPSPTPTRSGPGTIPRPSPRSRPRGSKPRTGRSSSCLPAAGRGWRWRSATSWRTISPLRERPGAGGRPRERRRLAHGRGRQRDGLGRADGARGGAARPRAAARPRLGRGVRLRRAWVYFHAHRFEEAAAAVESMDNPGLPQVMNAAMIYARLGGRRSWSGGDPACSRGRRTPRPSSTSTSSVSSCRPRPRRRAGRREPGEGGAADVRDARAAREEAGHTTYAGVRGRAGEGGAPKT